MRISFVIFLFVFISFLFVSCSKEDKFGGPVKEIKLEEIDLYMSDEGFAMFEKKCSSCHRIDEILTGTPLRGITDRRTPEWIMNMMLNPGGMVKDNKAASELYQKYGVMMSPQDISHTDARKILEYLRTQN
ncbi:MAG: cytochrome c [Ignavibacteria bacterium]|nr:cytochrome c [Ignavibacteria bacterium]